jgi:hypothetical protein
LGVFCILGAQARYDGILDGTYLFSFWLNRFLMGFVIALLPHCKILWKVLIRGAITGLFISFTFYSATNYYDLTGFLVGAIYGVIIAFAIYKFDDIEEQ